MLEDYVDETHFAMSVMYAPRAHCLIWSVEILPEVVVHFRKECG
jgi:hypothetical protein